VIAFLLVPREVYQQYLASLRSRSRGRAVALFGAAVFALGLPYFYELLVGFDNRGLAQILQIAIGAAAYFILIDAAYFAYQSFVRPSLIKRRRK
jgi:hypothetical protein